MIGPFNVVYGIGACVLTMLLDRHKDSSIIKLFLSGFVGGTILEYFLSLGMELMFGFTAWDYSHKFMNINGRVASIFYLLGNIRNIMD